MQRYDLKLAMHEHHCRASNMSGCMDLRADRVSGWRFISKECKSRHSTRSFHHPPLHKGHKGKTMKSYILLFLPFTSTHFEQCSQHLLLSCKQEHRLLCPHSLTLFSPSLRRIPSTGIAQPSLDHPIAITWSSDRYHAALSVLCYSLCPYTPTCTSCRHPLAAQGRESYSVSVP